MAGEKLVQSELRRESESLDSVDYLDDSRADKLDYAEKSGLNIDEQFLQYEELYQKSLVEQTFWTKMLDLEIPLNFENKKYFGYLIGAFASFGGFLSGVDQSIISGASLYMPDDLHLTDHDMSLVKSLMPLGGVLGAILLTPCAEKLGRKYTIIISCLFYTIGAILQCAAQSAKEMFAGRFLLGIGIGLESIIAAYVSECTEPSIRGNMVSLYQTNIAVGEVLGYAIAAIFLGVKGNWRYMLGSSLVFSTILFIGMFFLPESPRYHVHKGNIGKAYGIWKRLKDMSNIENKFEFMDMVETRHLEEEERELNPKAWIWLDIFKNPRDRRAITYAVIMIFLGQFTGINLIMYNLSSLLTAVGFDNKNLTFMSLVGGGSLMLGSIFAVTYMDTTGRRFWANVMLPGFFIGLILVGISYHIPMSNLPAVQGVYFPGIILYMFFFGPYSCLTWVIPSESFSNHLRSQCLTISTATLYLCAFIITYNFDKMQTLMTRTGLVLGFYGGIAVIGWVYQLLFMPETKGKTLEEIDDIFSKPTRLLVQENLKSVREGFDDIFHLRFKKLFTFNE